MEFKVEKIKHFKQYKVNAGKNVGSYNTSRLWHITDQSYRVFLKYLCHNHSVVFETIVNHVYQTVLTVNDDEEIDET